jgi:hypothetical protein
MSRIAIMLIVFTLIAGCGGGRVAFNLGFTDISDGLPGPADKPQIWRENIEAVDIDMDGLPDLITTPPRYHRGEPPKIFLNRGTRWQETAALVMPKLSFDYGWIESGPMADGAYPSLFVNSHATSVFALRGISPFSWEDESHGLPASFGGRAMDVGDINNDGLVDIMATMEIYRRGQKHTNVFIQTSEGWMPLKDNLPPDAFGPHIRLADFNNDGLLDMAMTLSTSTVKNYAYQGDGGKSWHPVTVTGMSPRDVFTIDVTDINGDGYDDLLMIFSPQNSSLNKPAIFIGSEQGLRELPTNFPPGNYTTITAGLIDCDNQMDIVLGGLPRGIEVYLQRKGSFEHALSIETPVPPRFLKLRDMNKDGSEDILAVFAARDKGSIRVFANSDRCPGTRIKNISDGKTMKMGSLIKVEYTSNKMETPCLRNAQGKLIPLKIRLNEYGRAWVVLPSVEEGQYELVLGDMMKRINLKKKRADFLSALSEKHRVLHYGQLLTTVTGAPPKRFQGVASPQLLKRLLPQ